METEIYGIVLMEKYAPEAKTCSVTESIWRNTPAHVEWQGVKLRQKMLEIGKGRC